MSQPIPVIGLFGGNPLKLQNIFFQTRPTQIFVDCSSPMIAGWPVSNYAIRTAIDRWLAYYFEYFVSTARTINTYISMLSAQLKFLGYNFQTF